MKICFSSELKLPLSLWEHYPWMDSLAHAVFRTRAVFSARTCTFSSFQRKFAKKKIIKFQVMHVVKVSQPFFKKLFKFSSLSSGQTASVHTLHMPKPVITFVFKVLYKMYYSGTVVTHATSENVRVQSATQRTCFGTFFTPVQTCDNVRVQSATEWTASVHT